MIGEFVIADRAIAHPLEVTVRLHPPFWQLMGRLLEGKLVVERRDFARTLVVLRDTFDVCIQTGSCVSYPEFKSTLAAAHLELGQLD